MPLLRFLDDIAAACPSLTDSDPLCPLAAFFCGFLPSLGDTEAMTRTMRAMHPSSSEVALLEGVKTPLTFLSQTTAATTLIMRGTRSGRDAWTDVRVFVADCVVRKKVEEHLRGLTDSRVSSAIRRVTDAMLREGWRMHRGMFIKSVALTVAISNRTDGTKALRLYGHSLGAACASMAYAFLREAHPRMPLVAAVMSCPDFCDSAARAAWLAPLLDPATFRHYHTEGDPVVHGLPAAAKLTSALATREHSYVCPAPRLSGLSRSVTKLLSHVMFRPAAFRLAGAGPPLKPGCGESHYWARVALVNPRYVALLEVKESGTSGARHVSRSRRVRDLPV